MLICVACGNGRIWVIIEPKGGVEMFAQNLKTLRKAKGLSQEELAIRLNVVRQTISKWEKELSVPDADLLIRLADILEVSVNELLGAKIENDQEISAIAEQLSRINEQLAIRNRRARRIWKVIAIIFIAFVIINILIVIFVIVPFYNITDNIDFFADSEMEYIFGSGQ